VRTVADKGEGLLAWSTPSGHTVTGCRPTASCSVGAHPNAGHNLGHICDAVSEDSCVGGRGEGTLPGAMRDDDELARLLVVGEVLVVMQEQRTL